MMTTASDIAITLLDTLTNGKNINVPNKPVVDDPFKQPESAGETYTTITKFEPNDLTTGVTSGEGIFDKIMVSLTAHLKTEYEANRISGAEYTKAYQALVAQALQTALSFLMSQEQVYWQTVLLKQQAQAAEVQKVQARVELETARVNHGKAVYEAETAAAQYASAQLQIALTDAQVNLVGKQGNLADAQAIGIGYDNTAKLYNNTDMLPLQKSGLEKDIATKEYQLTQLLPAQKNMIVAQTDNANSDKLLKDYQRTDILPAQKALYEEQRQSYIKDAKIKSAKMWTDVFITLKTMDIAITAEQFNSTNMDAVLNNLRASIAI